MEDGRSIREKLEGRELTSAGHLSAQDISFSEEITEIDGLLDFYMDTYFDVECSVRNTRLHRRE